MRDLQCDIDKNNPLPSYISYDVTQSIIFPFLAIAKRPRLWNFLDGGRGSGKTISASLLTLNKIMKPCNSNRRCLIARKTKESTKDSVRADVERAIVEHDLSNEFNTDGEYIICKSNKAKMVFKGYKDSNALKGIKSFTDCFLVWFEEGQDLTEEDLTILLPTFTRYSPIFIFTYNRYIESDAVHRLQEDIKAEDKNYIFSSYLDNPYTTEMFKMIANRTRENSEAEYQHEYMGKVSGRYLAFPNIKENFFNDINFKPEKYNWFLSMDWGIVDKCVIGFYAELDNNTILKFNEIILINHTPQEVTLVIKEKIRGLGLNVNRKRYFVADPSIWAKSAWGQSIGEDFQRLGITWYRASNHRSSGYLRIRNLMDNKQILFDINKVPETISCLSNLVMSDLPNERGDIYQHNVNDHAYDETRYALMSVNFHY